MELFNMIAGYSYYASFLVFIVASILVFLAGHKYPALMIGFSSASCLLIERVATRTRQNSLTKTTIDEYGNYVVSSVQSIWERIQYPSYLLAFFLISLAMLWLGRVLPRFCGHFKEAR